MIITRLIGGLGNQLFQYAFARRVAHFNRVSLKLDITAFQSYPTRAYRLNHFNILEDFASPEDVSRLKSPSARNPRTTWTALSNRVLPYYRRSCIWERSLGFDPNMLKVGGNAYLRGYWGNEKYFMDIEGMIRDELKVKDPPSPDNEQVLGLISSAESICIHVRRGDFVVNARTNQVHGVCSIEYYRKALELLTTSATNPHLFVFSDDPTWTMENLRFEHATTYVTHNGADRDYEDLRLMSACKHFIIANSTFSWWGAWLSTNPEKVVVAPRRWLADPTLNAQVELPDRWIRVE